MFNKRLSCTHFSFANVYQSLAYKMEVDLFASGFKNRSVKYPRAVFSQKFYCENVTPVALQAVETQEKLLW